MQDIDIEKIKIRLLSNIYELGLYDVNQLPIFRDKKCSLSAEPTDLVGLTGGIKDDLGFSPYWTDTSGTHIVAIIASKEYSRNCHVSTNRYHKSPSIRPVIEAESLPTEIQKQIKEATNNGEDEIELFEYPQFVEFDEDIIHNVNRLINRKQKSALTGKKYTLVYGSNLIDEYAYNNTKYIKISSSNSEFKLSNDENIVLDKDYIVKVAPIKWIYEKSKNLLVSKYSLLSGIPYWLCEDKTAFNESNMANFLQNIMLKDMVSIYEIHKNISYAKCISNNIFGISNLHINDTERMRVLLKSGISPFLHGFTGTGKSARTESVDSDHIKVYLSSSSLEDIEGKSVYVPPVIKKVERTYEKKVDVGTEKERIVKVVEYIDEIIQEGYMMEVKPTWLVRLEEKCASEPNKLHLVFFDEITHAPPSLQSGVFNIVLDGEVNGIWKIPENARVVLAGNDIDESIAAYEIAEPLYGRCGNIYVEDSLEDWILWANEKNIHPAIIGFMLSTNGILLRSRYDGERPNADPRKWEMASNILYKFQNISLLEPLVGKEITTSFNSFCTSKSVSLEDVLNNRYNDSVFHMNTNEKYATAVSLTRSNEEEFPIVREFMKKVGMDACAAFESMWIRNNPRREQILAGIKIHEKMDKDKSNPKSNKKEEKLTIRDMFETQKILSK